LAALALAANFTEIETGDVWDSQFDCSDHPHDGAAAPAEHRRVQPAAAG
jgi:hypothetical protein